MPQLVKLQDELKDSGFAIVGPHSQAGGQEDVAKFGRQYKINFTLTSGGEVPGESFQTLPMQFLFDSSGKLVEKGNHIPPQKVRDLVASEPHFLAAGRRYTKHKAEAELLKKSKSFGQILKKLEKDLKGEGESAEEAKYLTGRVRAFGNRQLEAAKAAEGEDPFAAEQAYTDLAASWKGDEVGEKASARLKELKADREFQNELKASRMVHQILAECEKLVAQNGSINLAYGPNQKIAAGVKSSVVALKKKYPEAKATAKVPQLLEGYGFKGL